MLDREVFRGGTQALLIFAGVWMMLLATSDRWAGAAALGAVAAGGIMFMLARHRLPSLFPLLFVSAGLVNAAGYVLNLWHETTPFDELVHFYTSFALCAIAGWLLLSRSSLFKRKDGARLTLAVVAIGLFVGILWELFEWAVGMAGGRRDTLVDLAMDVLGAVAAGLLCAWAARSNRQPQPRRPASNG